MTVLYNMRQFGVVTAVGFFGWLSGRVHEKYKSEDLTHEENNIFRRMKNLPGLPVFGTVSAATIADKDGRLALVQTRTSEIMKYGFPSLDHIRSYDDFVLSFNPRTRIANWVFEHITKDRLAQNKEVDRAKCEFAPDHSIHEYFRATNEDYFRSGFDRGHLAAAGNHRMQQSHVNQTFLLSNIAPQVGVGFNRDAWNTLEKRVRKKAKHYENTYICTGPLFVPQRESDGKVYVKYQVIGNRQVSVPTHFFKIILYETVDKQLHMEAFVMPNKAIENVEPLEQFMVSPDVIERSSGLLFINGRSQPKLAQINNKKTTYI